MNKIYLVRVLVGSYWEHTTYILDAFATRELAQKVCDGFTDTIEELSKIVDSKIKEANDLEDEYCQVEHTDEEYSEFYKKYNDDYELYFSIRDDNPTYSVQEIDLIN